MREVNESDAAIGYTYVLEYNTYVEEILLQDWAYLILFSIAVVGFFALLAILRKLFSSNEDNRPRDYKIKCSAARKVSNVIENAIALHTGAGAKGGVMVGTSGSWLRSMPQFCPCYTLSLMFLSRPSQRNYFLRGEQTVEVGGLFWTAKNLWSGHMSTKEGIKYPGRIFVGQVAQIVVTIVGVLYAIALILQIGREIDEERAELGSSYTQEDVDRTSNYEWATVTLDELYVTDEEQTALDTLPHRWQVNSVIMSALISRVLSNRLIFFLQDV